MKQLTILAANICNTVQHDSGHAKRDQDHQNDIKGLPGLCLSFKNQVMQACTPGGGRDRQDFFLLLILSSRQLTLWNDELLVK